MSNKTVLPLSLITPQDGQAAREYITGLIAARRAKRSVAGPSGLPADTQSWVDGLLSADTIAAAEAGQRSLATILDAAPVIELDVAAPLSPATLQTIATWLRREIHPAVMIRQRVDRNLLGGVRIRTGRAMYDKSIASALEGSRAVMTELIHGWA